MEGGRVREENKKKGTERNEGTDNDNRMKKKRKRRKKAKEKIAKQNIIA